MISLSKLKNSIYIRPGSLPLVTFSSVKLKGLLPDLKLNCATPSTVNFVNSPRELLKKNIFISILLSIMEAEDDYVEARLFYYRKLQT